MILITPHQEHWAEEYNVIKRKLMPLIKEKIIGVHHIGSTSVPGLPAKDVIDVH